MPKEALAGLAVIEGRAHALVEGNTFPFLNGIAHFLPNAKLKEVTGKLDDLKADFWSAKAQFLQKYASLRQSASEEWRAMARKLVKDPDRLVATIEASFPFPNQMDRYYAFDVQLFQIAMPQNLQADLIEVADQQAITEARERAASEASAKIRSGVESLVADCVASLREQTAQLCEEMLSSINNSETGVHQKTLNRLVNFIDQFKQMNFMNDREMEEQLEQVKRQLLTTPAQEYRDSRTARTRSIRPDKLSTWVGC